MPSETRQSDNMPELKREFTNFTPGELTYHESVEGGEYTAQEMKNLRIDTHGALRQRQSIRAVAPENSHNITGVAASTDRLFFINSNGQLFFRNRDRANQSDTEIPIHGRPRIITDTAPDGYIEGTKLSGRISIIPEYENFVILTSEGQDQGYWIDLRDTDRIVAYPLGFNPPTFEVVPYLSGDGITLTADQGIELQTYAYIYRFTYIRDARTPTEIANGSPELPPDEPFNDIESNPSEPKLLRIDTIDPEDRVRAIFLYNVKFPNPDGLEKGIAIYRSRPIVKTQLDDRKVKIDDMDLDFRRVGIYPPPEAIAPQPGAISPTREEPARFDDYMNEDDRAEQASLRFDNDRMPPAKTFTVFNDRVFAPNKTELRYSDIRFGNLALWAFPETNAIRRPVDCIFANTYRDMLLFGGRNGLWRMTGNAAYNFDPDRISNLGAIDPYAVTATEDVFGYIGTAGLHISDGISTQDISEPIQAHFENQKPVRGSVMFLPNSNTVWSVVFARLDGSLNRQTFVRARQFQQWADLEIEQNARFEQVNVAGDTETISVIVEDTPYTRQVLWENLTGVYDSRDIEVEGLTPIEWSWKSQKLDFQAEGIATERKRFTELIIEGKADTEITNDEGEEELAPLNITFLIYDTNNDVQTVTEQRTLQRPHLFKTRVPIRKIGIAIEFIVAGQGNVDIRSFCLKGSI